MSCCCVNTVNLCKVPICDGVLEIPFPAVGNQDYSLVLEFLGISVTLTQPQLDGENLKFDVSSLNELFEYTGRVYDSAGVQVNMLISTQIYDCVKFLTKLGTNLRTAGESAIEESSVVPESQIPFSGVWRTLLAASFGTAVNILAHTIVYGQVTGRQVGVYPTSDAQTWFVISDNCVAQNLTVSIDIAVPVTGDLVVTLRKNAADTALQVVIPAGSPAGAYSNTVDSLNLIRGDLIDHKFNNQSGGSTHPASVGLTLTGII